MKLIPVLGHCPPRDIDILFLEQFHHVLVAIWGFRIFMLHDFFDKFLDAVGGYPLPTAAGNAGRKEVFDFKNASRALEIFPAYRSGNGGFMNTNLLRDILQRKGFQVFTAFVKELLLVFNDRIYHIIDRLFPLFNAPDEPQGGIESVR